MENNTLKICVCDIVKVREGSKKSEYFCVKFVTHYTHSNFYPVNFSSNWITAFARGPSFSGSSLKSLEWQYT